MICPLCSKVLLEVGSIEYFCQTRIKFEGKASLPHYENREEGIVWYAPPYKITFKEGTSLIYTLDTGNSYAAHRFAKPNFKHVFTVSSELHPDDPEKVASRIKTLILFS